MLFVLAILILGFMLLPNIFGDSHESLTVKDPHGSAGLGTGDINFLTFGLGSKCMGPSEPDENGCPGERYEFEQGEKVWHMLRADFTDQPDCVHMRTEWLVVNQDTNTEVIDLYEIDAGVQCASDEWGPGGYWNYWWFTYWVKTGTGQNAVGNMVTHIYIYDDYGGGQFGSRYMEWYVIPGDSDGDGIKDDIDQCPDDMENFNGFEDEDGCPDTLPPPVDSDGDGVPDQDDDCPNEFGTLPNGCNPDPGPFCGDTICAGQETCLSCPEDCGVCPDPNPIVEFINGILTWLNNLFNSIFGGASW